MKKTRKQFEAALAQANSRVSEWNNTDPEGRVDIERDIARTLGKGRRAARVLIGRANLRLAKALYTDQLTVYNSKDPKTLELINALILIPPVVRETLLTGNIAIEIGEGPITEMEAFAALADGSPAFRESVESILGLWYAGTNTLAVCWIPFTDFAADPTTTAIHEATHAWDTYHNVSSNSPEIEAARQRGIAEGKVTNFTNTYDNAKEFLAQSAAVMMTVPREEFIRSFDLQWYNELRNLLELD